MHHNHGEANKMEQGKPDITKYFAKESDKPITEAFEKGVAVHPGGKSRPIVGEKMEEVFNSLLDKPREGKTSVYIHVPFCESHCLYCGFYREKYNQEESRLYTDALIRELQIHAEKPFQSSGPVHCVYLGGGTPTSLEADDLKRLLLALKQYLPLANDCEITVEGRIWNFDKEKMEACFEGGANRFSLGVQTFDSKIRQSMKRISDKDLVIKNLIMLRDFDQAAVVIDLIYGFPNQTMASWEEDIKIMQSLKIDGADLYQLKVFPGTPLHSAILRDKIERALSLEERAEMYERGLKLMYKEQYIRLSVEHWGRTRRERNIYNHMMKSPSDCLAFGPAAGGAIHGHFFFTETDFIKWQGIVLNDGKKPIQMMQSPSKNWKLEKTITSETELSRINFKKIGDDFGLNLEDTLSPLYSQWIKAGLVEKEGDWYKLTVPGQFWHVNLAQHTIDYLNETLLK
ncbi:MAG: heme anaerobic degradation radical SAM methyltransferase ChuW/HutW [Deltaproteobacteria bacterium]|nr:MAG: heme anaerobic degradation radical SAM methyltransferase ChuW/HutW [Deltaproteobacteria bacterium]PIE74915.1 MAG: heme anaerobic degradation radical SAM methyltransferase ChuW/HutW [Deltaproteobacteria bacterium]